MSDEYILHLRGLPWSVTEDEIIDFFSPIEISGRSQGIHLTLSRDGRPSGEAYVELANPDDMAEARKLHNKHIGRRYIEVFKATQEEMDHALKISSGGASFGGSSKPSDEDVESSVRLRGLPFGCSKEEILNFFDGLEVVPNGINLPTDYQGRQTGDAYVQFVDKETAERALGKHKERIGHRYIEIFKSTPQDCYHAMNNSRGGRGGDRGPYGGGGGGGSYNSRPSPYDSRDRHGGHNRYGGRRYDDYDNYGDGGYDGGAPMGRGNYGGGHCVHMRGLPFRASEGDIADFFRPLDPVDICIVKDRTGRPSGEADIEFRSHEEAVKAMARDKANMQHRYIELFLNSSPNGGGSGGGQSSGPSNRYGGGGGGRDRGGRYSRY